MFNNKWVQKIIRSVLIGGVSSYFYCPNCFYGSVENSIMVVLYYIIAFFLTYEFITWEVGVISKKYDWLKEPKKIIFVNLAITFFIFIPISYLGIELNFGFYPEKYSSMSKYFLNLDNFITSIFILFYLNTLNFFDAWKSSYEKTQELKQHQIKMELLALKNQINPHFLFNNLNTLTHLVSENNPNTEDYIHQLANIYRYLLDQKHTDVVPISKELNMIKSLVYILKIKHGDKIEFSIKVNDFDYFKIATFTLQMLVENTVKHNVISVYHKLKVDIYIEGDYLVIKNNVLEQPQVVYSSGIGLTNIINRYKLLSTKSVVIDESEKVFIVKIPKL